MKRIALVLLIFSAGAMLPGCPIYGSDDDGCIYDSDCPTSYVCDSDLGLCRPLSVLSCDSPGDCASNETCSRAGECRAGDCSWSDIGCVQGFACSRESGIWECVRGSSSGSGGSGGTSAGASSDAGASNGGGGGAT
jgi:hypothetical protein